MTQPVLSIAGLSKTFGANRALVEFATEIHPGEIRSIVGKNGSGKSTLVKLLSGVHRPDTGSEVTLDGEALQLLDGPGQLTARLVVVQQDLGLQQNATVLDNVLLHAESRGGFGLRRPRREERVLVERLLAEYGLVRGIDFEPEQLVSQLSDRARVFVSLARALLRIEESKPALLVLDEPTAHLGHEDSERVLAFVRGFVAQGGAAVYISHHLDEVLSLGGTLTVLRDGRIVFDGPLATVTHDQIVTEMLGEALPAASTVGSDGRAAVGRPGPAAVVEGIAGAGLESSTFEIEEGEILGVTGIAGAGFEELPYLLSGWRQAASGRLTLFRASGPESEARESSAVTHDLGRAFTPVEAAHAGIAVVPADRRRLGGAAQASGLHNLTISALDSFVRGGLLQLRRERAHAETEFARYQVSPADPDLPFSAFSGGNQQKIVLARSIRKAERLLVLHEPFQGVDVGVVHVLKDIIRNYVEAGGAVLIATSDYEDLVGFADRALVLSRGRITDELVGSDISEDVLVRSVFGTGSDSRRDPEQ